MPYKSARDLPIFREMEQQFRAMQLLKWLLPREDRAKFAGLRMELDQIADTADAFYDLLAQRNWVMHDNLNITKVRDEVLSAGDPIEAERALIAIYQEPDALRLLTLGLGSLEAMRPRRHLLRLALADYEAERFYSTTLLLIAVMDGFVNDFEPSVRRGMHARDEDQLDAWNSVSGHHLGLTHVLKTFKRSFKARIDDEVHELYRHGIVHGMVVNFDNVVVATKAWNYLFAVADWARGERKRALPPPRQSSWREIFSGLMEDARDRKVSDASSHTCSVPTIRRSQPNQQRMHALRSLSSGAAATGDTCTMPCRI